ncbi:heat-shock protein HspX [Saccharolobus solfataricus]|uniref:Heat-shock protein HspX n=2 Tax=Saccharolobus solfataricus TaxID=2287 RepID=A0A0E3MGC0_SACSO|nr:M48 family metallopeptidase [Saccharolobus solfataricus]AKA72901.1 heat-shock protein HspX [Saccharolobus solfataricus]AKA75600.1 heat-shock protein HspX [Saccharolobus solfataricus]AKA78293.1 heat-shock protein HspX [Saccharolobus solfataricus]AZF67412.1 heat-shock protein HspX [Saccharolobus solfataricus]AZF70032.1 heat-shock protein HspX [Saccharolobus solfataricus]
MHSITTYWWKYYLASFFSILVIGIVISSLNINIPYFFLIQIGLVFSLWYLISPIIMILVFKMRRAPQDVTFMVEDLSKKYNVKLSKVYIINDNFLNAFAFGNIIFRGIAVTSPLYESLVQEELAAVLSHEIAHIKNYDPEVMLLTIFSINSIYAALIYYLPLVSLFFLIIYFVILLPSVFYVHRKIEKRADLTAVKVNPDITYWLESSLIKIGYLSRSIPTNMLRYVPPIQIFLAKEFIVNHIVDEKSVLSFRTHPSLKERLLYLSQYEKQKMYYI